MTTGPDVRAGHSPCASGLGDRRRRGGRRTLYRPAVPGPGKRSDGCGQRLRGECWPLPGATRLRGPPLVSSSPTINPHRQRPETDTAACENSNILPAESARFVDCLEIGYPYAHISCSGARAVTGGEHGGRLTLGGSWLLKRTLWNPPPDPGRPGTTVACQRPRGA
jgi:hypothetical protein